MNKIGETFLNLTEGQDYRCCKDCNCSDLKYPLAYKVFQTERSDLSKYSGKACQEMTIAQIKRNFSSSRDLSLRGISSKKVARVYMSILNTMEIELSEPQIA